MSEVRERLEGGLAHALERTSFDWGARSEGKVRDIYTRAGTRILVTTDRLSAFDRFVGLLPLRGQVLNSFSAWWFEQTRDIVDNHVIAVPDQNVTVARECRPLLVEMVVRGYLTGSTSTSIWVHYARGERSFCGHALPDGMLEHSALPEPLVTPSTKAPPGQHDASVSRDVILGTTDLTSADFDRLVEISLVLFRRGQELCARHGVILVDTKYEFGKLPDGRMVLIDEIHTPDCSRFWDADDYAQKTKLGQAPTHFDKEFARRELKRLGFGQHGAVPELDPELRLEVVSRYVEVAERVMGRSLDLAYGPPLECIASNLSRYFSRAAASVTASP